MPTHPGRPQPEPLKTNDVLVAAGGTAVWLIALVVLLLVGLPSDQRWWLWVCLTGAIIGAFACLYIPRLQRKRDQEGPARAEETEPDLPPIS
ncbi:DUF2530 domain-containing protein [Actinocorallia populi]|uniref:DUF2530 domain-containing protein n=1 Tax=Actinocorallia populi TaxID=2079200 RepID=UPI000D08C369|nr:DUF2530 domain-containing protein [Actinocorallia populi]